MTTTAIEVFDPTTGELLDVRATSDEGLAAYVDRLQRLREQLAEHETVVLEEMVSRLDRNASWTLRVGDPADGVQYEITAPSPTAGTQVYDADTLRDELVALVDRKTISESAAEGALTRLLRIEARVPLDADLGELAKTIGRAVDVQIAEVDVRVVKVDTDEKPVAGGIAKLRKVPGTGAALDRAARTVPQGSRKAKVKAIRKEEIR